MKWSDWIRAIRLWLEACPELRLELLGEADRIATAARVWKWETLGKPLILGVRIILVFWAATFISPGSGLVENFVAGIPVGLVWGAAEKLLRG